MESKLKGRRRPQKRQKNTALRALTFKTFGWATMVIRERSGRRGSVSITQAAIFLTNSKCLPNRKT